MKRVVTFLLTLALYEIAVSVKLLIAWAMSEDVKKKKNTSCFDYRYH